MLRKTWKKTKTIEYIQLYFYIESARKKKHKKQFDFLHKKTQSVKKEKNSLESGIHGVLPRWFRYFGFV